MNKLLLTVGVLSTLSFGAMAETPSFDNIEVGYLKFDSESLGKSEGFKISGSKLISENFYIAGDYTDTSRRGFSIELTTIGLGYKFDFSESSSFFTELDFARWDTDFGFGENGYELTAGIRSMLNDQLEVKFAVEYLDIDNNDETWLVLGGAYNLSNNFSLYADYKYDSRFNRYGAGLRYNF